MQKIIQNGTRAVSIWGNTTEGPFTARLYVNCEAGQLGDATLTARKFKSLKGAERWAASQVGA